MTVGLPARSSWLARELAVPSVGRMELDLECIVGVVKHGLMAARVEADLPCEDSRAPFAQYARTEVGAGAGLRDAVADRLTAGGRKQYIANPEVDPTGTDRASCVPRRRLALELEQ